METYEVGKRYGGALGHDEGVMFDITDGGILLPLYFYKPDKQEIAELDASKPVRMSFLTKENVLIMLMKFGAMDWMDAPYTPHLSRNLTHLPEKVLPGEGLAVHLLLFDTATGELKRQRLFSLRDQLSNDLIQETLRLLRNPFKMAAYNADIYKAYQYDTDQLVRQAKKIYQVQ